MSKNIEICVVDPLKGKDGELYLLAVEAPDMIAAAKIVNANPDLGDFVISFTPAEIERFAKQAPAVLAEAKRLAG